MLFQTPNFEHDAAGDKADGYPQAAGSKLSESKNETRGTSNGNREISPFKPRP